MGRRQSLPNPLEVLWTSQRNTKEGGGPTDNQEGAIAHLTTLLSLRQQTEGV